MQNTSDSLCFVGCFEAVHGGTVSVGSNLSTFRSLTSITTDNSRALILYMQFLKILKILYLTFDNAKS